MRKILSAFVIAALAGSSLTAGEFLGLKNITVDGSIEVRGDRTNNAGDSDGVNKDTAGNTVSRLRLGVNTDVTEGVTGRVELIRNPNSTGNNNFYGGDETDTEEFTDELYIENAYVELTEFFHVEKIRLGRQYVQRPGDLLFHVGPVNDDILSIRGIDGLRAWEAIGKFDIDAFTGKFSENAGVGNLDDTGDVNLSYVRFNSDKLIDLGKKGPKIPLELGYYVGAYDDNSTPTDDNANLTILDLRAGFESADEKLKANIEYAMNGGQVNTGAGTDQDFKGNALLLGVAFEDMDRGFGLHANYANASGDKTSNSKDKSFRDFSAVNGGASDYRFGEIMSNSSQFGGVGTGSAGLDTGSEGAGLNVINIGGMYRLPWMDGRLVAKGDYYVAKYNETATFPDDIGNEIDLSVKYKHNNSVSAAVGYAIFSPGEAWATDGDDTTKMWAKMIMKWGGK